MSDCFVQALLSVCKILLVFDGLYHRQCISMSPTHNIFTSNQILNVFALLKMISSNLLICSSLDENFVPEMGDVFLRQ